MSRSRRFTSVALAALATAAGAVPATANAAQNPYSGEAICGDGYAFSWSTPLYSFKGGVQLATFNISYNAARNKTCVTLLKNRAIGTPSEMSLRVARKKYGQPVKWGKPDAGRFSYYAGPRRFKGPPQCALFLGGMKVDGGRSGYYGNSTKAVCK